MTGRTTGTWWRTNRWWLPAVPVALSLMLAAQSYRVEDFWWRADSHREVATGDEGTVVSVHDPGEDAIGEFTRRYRVELLGIDDAERITPEDGAPIDRLPSGARPVEVRLAFEADPDELLAGCRIVLVDADGVRYGGEPSDPLGQFNHCVPANRPGPDLALYADQVAREEDTPPRPATWTVTHTVVVPEEAEIVEVRVSFDPPEYVALRPAR